MICPKCNTKNPEGTKYCSQCGVVLPERDEFDSGGFKSSMPGTMSGMNTTANSETIEASLKKGSTFAGRYEILNDGFKGGMGMVYKVQDKTLGKTKALKFILSQFLENEKAVSRFKQEVAITQELVHENIVRVYDIGESDGMIYFTMEWIDGISMRDYISERKKQNNRLSFEEAKYLIKQVCSALSYAHEKFHIIHRDIKPENLLMIDPYSKSPKVKIADFGIAKTESQTIHQSVSAYMGTPIYMAPEQYTDASKADKRADIYSVGAILYELLTFMHPLGTFPMPTEVNPSLPKKIDVIIKKVLSADKTKRYDDAMEIIKALELSPTVEEEVSKTAPVQERTTVTSHPASIPEKKKSMLVPFLVGLIVIILIAGGYMIMSSKNGKGDSVVSLPADQSGGSTGQPVTRGGGAVKDIGGQSEQTPKVVLPTGNKVEQPVQITQPIEDIPFELGVNLLGQREISSDNYEEIIIKNGSTLKSNDNFKVYLRTTQDCYVYVLMFDSEGKASMLFPGMAGSNNRVKGNKNYQVPAGNDWFFLDENKGTETIYVIADINPMTDIDSLLADMERKGNKQQKEDSQKILTQVAVLKRGVGGITTGRTMAFKTSDGDTINNVSQVVKGKGSLVWSVSFKHI